LTANTIYMIKPKLKDNNDSVIIKSRVN